MAMDKVSKSLCLLLFMILAASCLLIIQPSYAQAGAQPSAPRFTAKFVDASYDVPTTTTSTMDPYTGKTTITTNPGYHVNARSLEVIIENQQFPSSVDGIWADLRYQVAIKGHYQKEWYPEDQQYYGREGIDLLPIQSSSKFTTLHFPADYPTGGQIDIRVQALLVVHRMNNEHIQSFPDPYVIRSDWSDTQTLETPSANSSLPSPTVPELSWFALLPLCLIVLSVALVLKRRKP
jgi:hypothetical protein